MSDPGIPTVRNTEPEKNAHPLGCFITGWRCDEPGDPGIWSECWRIVEGCTLSHGGAMEKDKQGMALLSKDINYANIKLTSPDGRFAFIDFSGGKVVYSGDLPVDESAKIFFDAFPSLCEQIAMEKTKG